MWSSFPTAGQPNPQPDHHALRQQKQPSVLEGCPHIRRLKCNACLCARVFGGVVIGRARTADEGEDSEGEGAGGENDLQADEAVAAAVQLDVDVLLRVLYVLPCTTAAQPLHNRLDPNVGLDLLECALPFISTCLQVLVMCIIPC